MVNAAREAAMPLRQRCERSSGFPERPAAVMSIRGRVPAGLQARIEGRRGDVEERQHVAETKAAGLVQINLRGLGARARLRARG